MDGDLAVLTGRVSKFGGFLDSLLDRYGDAAILTGMIYHILTMDEHNLLGVFIGMAALSGSLIISYSRARARSDLGLVFKRGFTGYAANRDVRLFIIMLGGILNQVLLALTTLAVLTNLVILKRLYEGRKAARQ